MGLPSRCSRRVAQKRQDRDEGHPGGQLAAKQHGQAQPSNAADSGASAKCIPAAAAPSASSPSSPTCSARSGSTPSRRGQPEGSRVGLRGSGLGAGHDRGEEVRDADPLGARSARCPSSRRRRARARVRGEVRASTAPGIASKRIAAMKESTNDSGSSCASAVRRKTSVQSQRARQRLGVGRGPPPAGSRRPRRRRRRRPSPDHGRSRARRRWTGLGTGSRPEERAVAVDSDGVRSAKRIGWRRRATWSALRRSAGRVGAGRRRGRRSGLRVPRGASASAGSCADPRASFLCPR